MTTVFSLPDVGEGLTEADIISWKVAAGDTVAVNQILVEIETAKSLVELPSPHAGMIAALLVEEGQTVPVGTPIVRFAGADNADPAGGADPAADAGSARGGAPAEDTDPARGAAPGPDDRSGRAEQTAAAEPQAGASGPNLVGYGVQAGSSRRRPRRDRSDLPAQAAPPAASPLAASLPAVPQPEAPSQGGPRSEAPPRPRAKPPVRRLAKDRGVDLRAVAPTGQRGEVTREDLLAHLRAGDQAPSPSAQPTSDSTAQPTSASTAQHAPGSAAPGSAAGAARREERIPLRGVGRAMAQAMTASAFTAPHVTEFLDIDMTGTMEFVRSLRTSGALGEDIRVSPLLIAARATAWAALRHPWMNARLDGDDVVLQHYVDLGIAAATPRGLLVPVLRNVEAMGLSELAGELGALIDTARAGRTTPEAQHGGTITLTNIGVFGIDSGTPIINPGQTAIVALGAVKKRPWVVDDRIVVREVATLSVSADHRVVDGEKISLFLSDLGAALEDPRLLLT